MSGVYFSGEGEYVVECVTYKAPSCHSGIGKVLVKANPTIKVYVKRLRVKGDEEDDAANVWLISGANATPGKWRFKMHHGIVCISSIGDDHTSCK